MTITEEIRATPEFRGHMEMVRDLHNLRVAALRLIHEYDIDSKSGDHDIDPYGLIEYYIEELRKAVQAVPA